MYRWCTSTNEKSEIASEREAITFLVAPPPELENSFVNSENKTTKSSTLSAETTSSFTSQNVVEKVSKEAIISATTTTKNYTVI